MRLAPILPHTRLYDQRHRQLCCTFHLRFDKRSGLLHLVFLHLEYEFVMDLQEHPNVPSPGRGEG